MIAGVVGLHIWALHVVGPEQPDRARHQDAVRHGADGALRRHEGRRSRWRCSCCCSPGSCSTCPTTSATPTTTSRPTRSRRRRTSCRSGTSCPTTPSCARSPTSCCGVIAMFSSILLLIFVPWLDTSRVRSAKYRPDLQVVLLAVHLLGGRARLSRLQAGRGRLRALGARLHGLLLPPSPGGPADRRGDRDAKPLPRSITESVLGKEPAAAPKRLLAPGEASMMPSDRREDVACAAALLLASALALRRRAGAGGRRARAHRPRRSGASAASSATSTRRSCSAASRSTPRSARAATASSASPSATWREPGGPELPRRRRQVAGRHLSRSTPSPTTRARSSSARPSSPTPFPSPYKNEQEARAALERRAAARPVADHQGARHRDQRAVLHGARSTCCATSPPAIRRRAPTTSTPSSRATSEPPAGTKVADGMNYNKAFPGHHDRHAQSVRRRRRPRQVRRRHAARPSTTTRAT